jgi:broad specificity phosphatase PhoE
MKVFNSLLVFLITLNSLIYGDCFQKNDELIETFRSNDLKIIVLYTYESTHNVLDIVTSSRSPGFCLTAKGQQDLQDSVPVLSTQNITSIYTALTFRAQQATNLLGIALSLQPAALKIDSRLGVQNLGDYSGMDFNMYKIRFGSVANLLQGTPPNGESGCALYTRTNEFLESLAGLQNQTVLVVTHAFNFAHISKILTGQFETLPSPGDFRVYDFTIPVAQ